MIRPVALALITMCSQNLGATAEVALPSGAGTGLTGPFNVGTNLIGTSAAEIACLVSRADPTVKPEDARKFAEGTEGALKKLKFEPGEMPRSGLLHYFSQTLIESAHLKTTEQKGAPSENKKGWGWLQVTSPANLRECGRCMNECSSPDGSRMLADKKGVVGDRADDGTAAALLSLCWWKKNVVENIKHSSIVKQATAAASRMVTQVVNAGGVGRRVTGGEKNLAAREKLFTSLEKIDSEGTCRKRL